MVPRGLVYPWTVMKTQLSLLLSLVLLAAGCGPGEQDLASGLQPPSLLEEQAAAPEEELAEEELAYALGPGESTPLERSQQWGDIVHSRVRLQVGRGPYDVVTLHRVVRESSPGRPAPTRHALLLLHGDGLDFQGAFLHAERSLATYLAARGVDVWGMDLRWAGVPLLPEPADFSFMRDWNLGTHVEDLRVALERARRVRRATGSGSGKLALLGWSRGGVIGYAYLAAESQRPGRQRHVRAFIPLDTAFKLSPQHAQQMEDACERAALGRTRLQRGQYEGGLLGPRPGVDLAFIGSNALFQPDALAPGRGVTFRQLALFVGAATFNTFLSQPQPLEPPTPYYHLTAGRFDAFGLPTHLTYTREHRFFETLAQARPYQSLTEVVESDELLCNRCPSPYEEHLAEVRVPVLYVGAAGGFGRYGSYSKQLLGGRKAELIITKGVRMSKLDYGHADLLLAEDADTLVWAPLLEWLKRQ